MPGEVDWIPGHQVGKASSGPAIRRLILMDISFVQDRFYHCTVLPSSTKMLQGESLVLVQSPSSS